MKPGKSHTQTECLLCPCRSTNVKWVLDTIQMLYLMSLVHLFCSLIALHPGFSSYFKAPQSQLMTFPPAAAGNRSHQMSTTLSDHHPMHNHPPGPTFPTFSLTQWKKGLCFCQRSVSILGFQVPFSKDLPLAGVPLFSVSLAPP